MKNLIIYYLFILIPIVALVWLFNSGEIGISFFAISILIYSLVYRTILDGMRLVVKNIIPKNDIWKMIIPGKRFIYFKELYWI